MRPRVHVSHHFLPFVSVSGRVAKVTEKGRRKRGEEWGKKTHHIFFPDCSRAKISIPTIALCVSSVPTPCCGIFIYDIPSQKKKPKGRHVHKIAHPTPHPVCSMHTHTPAQGVLHSPVLLRLVFEFVSFQQLLECGKYVCKSWHTVASAIVRERSRQYLTRQGEKIKLVKESVCPYVRPHPHPHMFAPLTPTPTPTPTCMPLILKNCRCGYK